jgi:plastocyanin domain-containing protein
MFSSRKSWVSWGFGSAIGAVLMLLSPVQAADMNHQMTDPSTSGRFQQIEQPLGVKAGVTLGGLALIGLELWWFLGSKTKPKTAQSSQGVQELEITVDGGYSPDQIVVKAGQPVRLKFFRRDPNSCLEQVLFPDFHIAQDLDLNQVTPVEFTPEQPGQYAFTCGMNMFRGVVKVEN